MKSLRFLAVIQRDNSAPVIQAVTGCAIVKQRWNNRQTLKFTEILQRFEHKKVGKNKPLQKL